MKRFISLALTILMLMMSIQTAVFAEGTITEKTFRAIDDIYNRTEGEGFHHNTSAQGRVGLETDGDNVVLRQAEWICYDVSDFKSGTYNLTIKVGSTNAVPLTVLIDDVEVLKSVEVASTGGYNNQQDVFLGQVEFSGSQKKIKILNAHKLRALFVNSFTLEKLDPLTFSSYAANAGSGDVIARGADSFTITMSAEVEASTVSSDTVMIKDSEGNALDAEVSVSGNDIVINLKESLDFEGVYTIYIEGVESTSGQELAEPVSKPFEVADSSDMSGSASIEVTSFSAENGLIEAEGIVKSSQNLGISGRDVTLSLKPEDGEYEIKATATSQTDGTFSISYEMPESSDAGKYEVQITSDYVNDAYEASLLYFTTGNTHFTS